eukprot:15436482-Alexandrium_andersonii.AAC.1
MAVGARQAAMRVRARVAAHACSFRGAPCDWPGRSSRARAPRAVTPNASRGLLGATRPGLA